ncbi:hypothetical protein GCM10023152_14360 [Agromyces bauzanensis]|uniref:Uncharacterized protein n=1 Tax=Agromyces bauzanensis TaxID=1308924 RepID=A0A917UPF7_9MICO|nr:hypothetical protein GCM10011372_08590 [Agromyces bauzanensis]
MGMLDGKVVLIDTLTQLRALLLLEVRRRRAHEDARARVRAVRHPRELDPSRGHPDAGVSIPVDAGHLLMPGYNADPVK